MTHEHLINSRQRNVYCTYWCIMVESIRLLFDGLVRVLVLFSQTIVNHCVASVHCIFLVFYDQSVLRFSELLTCSNQDFIFSHSEVCFTVKDLSSSMGVLQWG